jgi:hypothetical protein
MQSFVPLVSEPMMKNDGGGSGRWCTVPRGVGMQNRKGYYDLKNKEAK